LLVIQKFEQFFDVEPCGLQVIMSELLDPYLQRLFNVIFNNNRVTMVDAIPPPVETGGLLAVFFEAAVGFLDKGGERATIASLDSAAGALAGRAGTRIRR
jgi:hypothetical protein